MVKKLAIIGGGNVGGTLARRFLDAGLNVAVGVPNPEDSRYVGLPVCSPKEAAHNAEATILATPWGVTQVAVEAILPLIQGKVLIDATNPIAPDFSGLTHSYKDSGGLQVARWAPGAHVVKAFNTIGFNIMANPVLAGVPSTLFVAGDDRDAKALAMELARMIDFAPLDVGSLERSSLTEAVAWLWISLARGMGRDFVFNYHASTNTQ